MLTLKSPHAHIEVSFDPLRCRHCMLFVHKQHAVTAEQRINADFSVNITQQGFNVSILQQGQP